MGIWRSIKGFLSGAAFRQQGTQSGSPSYYQGSAAANVNVDTSMQLSAVWSCCKIRTENIASLPLHLYKIADDGTRQLLKDHKLSLLLNGKINRWQTRQEFLETMLYQEVLLGNSYAYKQRNRAGEIVGLVPLMSMQMEVILNDNGSITYRYTDEKGPRNFTEDDIWHNKLMGNGTIGLNPLAYARNSVGVGLAAEGSVSKIYANGGKPSGILTIDKVLKDDQRVAVKKNFDDLSHGESQRLFVLEAGMKWQQVSLSPQDIELLQSRRFQIEDICRFWGVPSVLVNDTQSSTAWGSGVQQIVQGFYKMTLRPHMKRLQDNMRISLLKPEERFNHAFEFDLNDLLMPDRATRLKSGKEGITGGVLTPNEVRAEEGLPPLPGGDSLYLQQQMVPIADLKNVQRGQQKKGA